MTARSRSHVLYRHDVANQPPVAVGGDGPWVIDSSGRRYLDASGGAAVCCLGYGNTRVKEAVKAQVDRLAYAHSRFFTTEAVEALADELVTDAPEGLSKVWFTCGGSEAIEAALKITRQYFVEIGQPERKVIIGRRQGYHGNTLGALSASGNIWRRRHFQPMLISVTEHISPCFPYRDRGAGESPEAYGLRVANELEAKIDQIGSGNVAAFVAETVVGSTLGAVTAVPGYFRRIRDICDRHGVLLILDEVMCGMGRTGTRFACTQEGIAPDLVAFAKGLGAGYLPIGALVMNGRIAEAIEHGSNIVMHGHTFMGHAAACAAALATQHEIRDRELLDNVRRMGAYLSRALEVRFGTHPHVGDIRGRGLLLALEIVRERASKEPFDPALKMSARIKQVAMQHGLMCYPMGGLVDGRRGDNVLLAPAFDIAEEQLDEIVARLGRALDAVLETVRTEVA